MLSIRAAVIGIVFSAVAVVFAGRRHAAVCMSAIEATPGGRGEEVLRGNRFAEAR